ncbi:MAG: hypothetical protein GY764_09030 [Halieaceae bacterium]|nr:hypothetical protein [Halieaceae bacterium]
MRLFAEVYLDEDVSVLIAVLLRARGINAMAARDEDMLGQDDPIQLAHAASLERCIVTHNRIHFESLHREYVEGQRTHWGIIAATRRSPYEIGRRLGVLLNTLTADEIQNQLLYV